MEGSSISFGLSYILQSSQEPYLTENNELNDLLCDKIFQSNKHNFFDRG